MKRFMVVAISMVMVFLLVGCGSIQTQESSVCNGVSVEESLICQKIPNPEMVSSTLLAANYGAIKSGTYSKEQALKVVGELQNIVDSGGISYMYLITRAAELIDANEAAAVILILSPNVNLLQSPLQITPFDQQLLTTHLNYQRQLIALAE